MPDFQEIVENEETGRLKCRNFKPFITTTVIHFIPSSSRLRTQNSELTPEILKKDGLLLASSSTLSHTNSATLSTDKLSYHLANGFTVMCYLKSYYANGTVTLMLPFHCGVLDTGQLDCGT